MYRVCHNSHTIFKDGYYGSPLFWRQPQLSLKIYPYNQRISSSSGTDLNMSLFYYSPKICHSEWRRRRKVMKWDLMRKGLVVIEPDCIWISTIRTAKANRITTLAGAATAAAVVDINYFLALLPTRISLCAVAMQVDRVATLMVGYSVGTREKIIQLLSLLATNPLIVNMSTTATVTGNFLHEKSPCPEESSGTGKTLKQTTDVLLANQNTFAKVHALLVAIDQLFKSAHHRQCWYQILLYQD